MKKNILTLTALLALMGVMAGAAPIKIGYSDWPGYTVLEVAKQKGWFKDAGLDVELDWFDYSPSIDAFAAEKLTPSPWWPATPWSPARAGPRAKSSA